LNTAGILGSSLFSFHGEDEHGDFSLTKVNALNLFNQFLNQNNVTIEGLDKLKKSQNFIRKA
jgi:hypothetical protein